MKAPMKHQLVEALRGLSALVEQPSARQWVPADHACGECVPGGANVKRWFLCARHAALDLLARSRS
jgi:hypothetical protein